MYVLPSCSTVDSALFTPFFFSVNKNQISNLLKLGFWVCFSFVNILEIVLLDGLLKKSGKQLLQQQEKLYC